MTFEIDLPGDTFVSQEPTDSAVMPACLMCRYGIEVPDMGIYCNVFSTVTYNHGQPGKNAKPCHPGMPAQRLRMRHLDEDLVSRQIEMP